MVRSYYHENISIEDVNKKYEHICNWVWEVEGLHVPAELCKAPLKVKKTFVMYNKEKNIYIIGVEEKEDYYEVMYEVDKLSCFDDIKSKYPNLYELTSSLIIVG